MHGSHSAAHVSRSTANCATPSRRSGRSVHRALDRLLPGAAGSIQSTGSASGALKSPHVIAEAARRESALCRLARAAAGHRCGCRRCRRQPVAPGRAGSPLGRGSPLIDRLQVTGTGLATDHRIAIDVTGFPPQPQLGAPHAVMEIAGRYDKEVWNATITTTELSTGAANQQLKIPEPATVDRVARPRTARQLLSRHRRRTHVRRRQVATRRRVAGNRLRLRDSARVRAAAERRGSGDRGAHRRSRACVRRAGPAVAGRSGRTHHRRRDHLPAARRGAGDAQSRHRRSRRDRHASSASSSRSVCRRSPTRSYMPSARLQRDGRNDILQSAVDRRHARARRRREHPAAGVSRKSITLPAC